MWVKNEETDELLYIVDGTIVAWLENRSDTVMILESDTFAGCKEFFNSTFDELENKKIATTLLISHFKKTIENANCILEKLEKQRFQQENKEMQNG